MRKRNRIRPVEGAPMPEKLQQSARQVETPRMRSPAPYRRGVTPGKSDTYRRG